MSEEDEAPGWDAIDAVFERLYPGQKPDHWGTLMPARVLFGGPEVLDGISAYRADEPVPHWHWITYGLTELYAKESDDPEWSGWGYELTMRVPRGEDEERPPEWPIPVLQQLANYAHRTKRLLQPGEWFDTRAKLTNVEGAVLTGLGFVTDPALPAIDTPHGRVEFVEVLGLRPEELAWCADRGVQALVDAAARPFAGDFNVLSRESFAPPG